MNVDNEYLRMILALPDEFFEGWEWKAGDKGLIIPEKREVAMLGQTGQLIWYYDRGDLLFNPEHIKNDIAASEINYIRPIPSQEQLQKLSGLDWDLYYHDLVKNYSEYDSAEQAGLAMIMYSKYGKKWVDGKWKE